MICLIDCSSILGQGRLNKLGDDKNANHYILLHEYLLGQGIMLHLDGPLSQVSGGALGSLDA
jgi:hypothetical protein